MRDQQQAESVNDHMDFPLVGGRKIALFGLAIALSACGSSQAASPHASTRAVATASVLDQTGKGSMLVSFTALRDWDLQYAYDCSESIQFGPDNPQSGFGINFATKPGDIVGGSGRTGSGGAAKSGSVANSSGHAAWTPKQGAGTFSLFVHTLDDCKWRIRIGHGIGSAPLAILPPTPSPSRPVLTAQEALSHIENYKPCPVVPDVKTMTEGSITRAGDIVDSWSVLKQTDQFVEVSAAYHGNSFRSQSIFVYEQGTGAVKGADDLAAGVLFDQRLACPTPSPPVLS